MAALFVWLWVIGGAPAAILGEVVRADSPRTARAGRIAFALLLWAKRAPRPETASEALG